MKIPYYYLKVMVEGRCGAIAGVNHAPLFMKHSPEGGATNMPLNEFLLPGKNCLTGHLFWHPEESYEEGKTRFEAIVYEADPGEAVPQPGKVLARHVFPTEENEEAYPHVFELEFDLGGQEGLVEPEAVKLEGISREDHADIGVLISRLIDALIDGDEEKAWSLTHRRYETINQANGFDPATQKNLLKQQIASLAKVFGGKEIKVDFAMDELAIRPCYDQRLCWVSGSQNQRGAFTLYTEDPLDPEKVDRSFALPVYVGKTGEGWEIFL